MKSQLRYVFTLALLLCATLASAATAPVIKVLSNRADMLSAGDALVEVVLAEVKKAASIQVLLNGKNISDDFAVRDNGRFMGLVEGMVEGENVLRVSGGGFGTVSTTLINYPNYGPIFSAGQHRLDGWEECKNGQPSSRNDCNMPVEYSFLYKSSNPMNGGGLIAFNPEDGIPADVASAQTDNGETVPFIVRQEKGYQDRDRYTILTLFKPEEEWAPWAPQSQWNGKLLITHGGNCGLSYNPGNPRLSDYSGTIPENPALEQSYVTALGKGYAVLSTALDNTGHNCDVVLGAESLMMAKERFVEQYGLLRFTIGTGCSGGSIAQATIANAYPGIYQGLLTMCSYPDSISAGGQFADLHLMRNYFENPSRWSPAAAWSPHQFGLVEGHLTHVNAVAADEGLFKAATNPVGGCYPENAYDPQNNPGGVRCTIIDWMAHIFGPRKPADWSEMEVAANKAFTALPLGNTGVQYGLNALKLGQITPEQFVDLNVKIGGLTVDIKPKAERTRADAGAIARMFRSGMANVTNNLNTVPIINFLGPDPGIAHDSVHAFWTRWRLEREHGNHDNHVMWGGPAPLIGDTQYVYQGLDAMSLWLEAIEADDSDRPIAEKVVGNKPASISDQCSDGYGHAAQSEECIDVLQLAYAYGTPRTIAGADRHASNFECQLKEFDAADYAPVILTDDQLDKLKSVYPNGVCDYSKPGVGEETKTETWLGYRDANGGVVIGGEKLPPVPENSREGWASPAFTY